MFHRLNMLVTASLLLTASTYVAAAEFKTTGSESSDTEVKKQIENTNAACGSDLGFVADRAAWKKSGKSPQHCETPLSALQNWCSSKYDEVGKQDDIKKFVKTKIKTVKCSYVEKAGARSIKLSGGTLSYTADSDMLINDGYVVGYLESQLDPDPTPAKKK